MAVYYKFKGSKDFDSVPMDGQSITLGHLKEVIFTSKRLGRVKDFEVVVTNSETYEEYVDDCMVIPAGVSLLIGPIILLLPQVAKTEMKNPKVRPAVSSNLVQAAAPPSKTEEDGKIHGVIDAPALDWQQIFDGFGHGGGFMAGMSGRIGGRDFVPKGEQASTQIGNTKMQATEEHTESFVLPEFSAPSEVRPAVSSNLVQAAAPPSKTEEDSKIHGVIDAPALDSQQIFDGFGHGGGFVAGMSSRMGGRDLVPKGEQASTQIGNTKMQATEEHTESFVLPEFSAPSEVQERLNKHERRQLNKDENKKKKEVKEAERKKTQYQCLLCKCQPTFYAVNLMMEHNRTVHKAYKTCSRCQQAFYTLALLKGHKKSCNF